MSTLSPSAATTALRPEAWRSRAGEPALALAPSQLQIALWAALCLATVLLSLYRFGSNQIGAIQDDASYILLARSIAFGSDYGLIYAPGHPAPSQYPFGYPLLLSPLVRLLPGAVEVLKWPSLFATLVSGGLLFFGWRRLVPSSSYWWGLAVTALTLLSTLTLGHAKMVMTEPFFLAFYLAAMLLAERYALGPVKLHHKLLLAVAIVFTVFTRTIGAAAIAGLGLYLLVRLGKAGVPRLIELALFVAALVLLVVVVTPVHLTDLLPTTYLGQMETYPVRVQQTSGSLLQQWLAGGVDYFTRHLRLVIVPVGGGQAETDLARRIGLPFLPALAGLAFSGLMVAGAARLARREGLSAFGLSAVCFIAALFLWPFRAPRFLYPVQPQLFAVFLLGVQALLVAGSRLLKSRPALRPAVSATLVALVVALLALHTVKAARAADSRAHTGDLAARTAWLAAHTDPGAVVMSELPEVDYLYGGRKIVPLVAAASAADLEQALRGQSVGYVLIAPELLWQAAYQPHYSAKTRAILPLVESLAAAGRLELVFANEAELIRVYKVGS